MQEFRTPSTIDMNKNDTKITKKRQEQIIEIVETTICQTIRELSTCSFTSFTEAMYACAVGKNFNPVYKHENNPERYVVYFKFKTNRERRR